MFESKLFNQWLEEIKARRIKDLLEVKEMVNTFKLARKEQLMLMLIVPILVLDKVLN